MAALSTETERKNVVGGGRRAAGMSFWDGPSTDDTRGEAPGGAARLVLFLRDDEDEEDDEEDDERW